MERAAVRAIARVVNTTQVHPEAPNRPPNTGATLLDNLVRDGFLGWSSLS
jgi:hypothetical protein